MVVYIETSDGMFLQGDLLDIHPGAITIDEQDMGVITVPRSDIYDLYGDVMLEEMDNY